MEAVEVVNCSLYFLLMRSAFWTDCGMSQAEITEKLLYSKTGPTIGSGWGTAHKMVKYDLLFHLFPNFYPLSYGPKITRLNKIYISTRKSSLSEVKCIPIWINTIGRILLDIMAYSPVCFTILTNNIYYNPTTHMVVPFLFFSSTLTRKFSRYV